MSLPYDPNDAAVPILPWNISYLSQRDVAIQVPIDFATEPGVSLQAACFPFNRYEDIAAAQCFSNLLAIGFRRFLIDVYWDEHRGLWSLCPVQIPASAARGTLMAPAASTSTRRSASTVHSMTSTRRSGSATTVLMTSPSPSTATATAISSLTRRSAQGIHGEELDRLRRQATALGGSSSVSRTTVTLSPTTSANSTYIVFPTGPTSRGEVLYSIGPYTCTTTLNLGAMISILQQYISATDDTLHAFVNVLILNIHAASSPFYPTGPASAPIRSLLPRAGSLLSSILNNDYMLKLFTPQLLQQQRSNLNMSWLDVASTEQPLLDYFKISESKNRIVTTQDGWPDAVYLQAASHRRLVAGFGTVDPQMTLYNFTGDNPYIFPPSYVQNQINVTSNRDGMIQSGCIYSSSTTNLSLANSSFAISTDLTQLPIGPLASPLTINSTHLPFLPSVSNLTSCGISPLLNQTLANTTADQDYTPYQAFAYNTIWSWAPGEPTNSSSNRNSRCAVLDPALNGRWRVADCGLRLRAACVSNSSPYSWTLTTTNGSYPSRQNTCPANYTFMAPRGALENRYLLETYRQSASATAAAAAAASSSVSPTTSSSDSDLLWINFNSRDVEFCWVVGVDTKCPYVPASHVSRIAVPTIAGVIILFVAALLIVIKCRSNRQNSRRSRRGDGGWDYEGVPS